MERANILYDHYKDTISKQEMMIKTRNRFFVYLMIGTFAFCTWGMEPYNTFEQIMSMIEKEYKIRLGFQYFYGQTFLWIIYSYLLARYYQAVIYIERQYKYIEQLECNLSDDTQFENFNRESKAYLRGYPWSLTVIHFFYNIIVPISILLSCWQRIYYEYIQPIPYIYFAFDALFALFASCIIINFIYFMRRTL